MSVDDIFNVCKIDQWFVNQIKEIVDMESEIPNIFKLKGEEQKLLLRRIKQFGFSDKQIAIATGKKEEEIRALRKELKIIPVYKLVEFLFISW